MGEKPTVVLKFELAGPATPARVARAAQAIEDLLRTTDPDLPEDAITMVVTNLQMRGEVRAWTRSGTAAVNTAADFLTKPERAVARTPGGRQIAAQMRKPLRLLAKEGATISKPRAKKPLRRLDDEFVNRVGKAAEGTMDHAAIPVRGEDVIVSRVFRVGRRDAESPIRARVICYGVPHEVEVPKALAADFFDAAKDDSRRAITIAVTWKPGDDGRLVPDLDNAIARAISVDPIAFAPFEVLLADIKASVPDVFDDLDAATERARGD